MLRWSLEGAAAASLTASLQQIKQHVKKLCVVCPLVTVTPTQEVLHVPSLAVSSVKAPQQVARSQALLVA